MEKLFNRVRRLRGANSCSQESDEAVPAGRAAAWPASSDSETPRVLLIGAGHLADATARALTAAGAAVKRSEEPTDHEIRDALDDRVDRVVVSPVPGTGDRFPLFTLDPDPLPHDRATMAPMGCLPGDWNEDGRTDLLVY